MRNTVIEYTKMMAVGTRIKKNLLYLLLIIVVANLIRYYTQLMDLWAFLKSLNVNIQYTVANEKY